MQQNTPDLPPRTQLALAETHLGQLLNAQRDAGEHEQLIQQVTDRYLQIQAWRRLEYEPQEFMLSAAREWSRWWTASKYARG